ncbi:DUF3349 domain-containing protein [Mycobacterium sp. 1465703.0]|uniref:DUF3349 domain-containing protein n=1 Tax=Mycobacterium sp. 1465703.0 TaxID=1834078 RepID=UPI0007FF8C99|nr:DUF3349 domain-containing protein [Mycobacterium sp. 1465703.0]OBJ09341.1 hypothetical protein A5625_13290 [Mycobacterium sp. 1465703.0]
MGLLNRVSSVVAFLRVGYPERAPAIGYATVLALLPPKVSDDDIIAIARRLLVPRRGKVDRADVGVEIMAVTDQLPSADDIERVLVAVKTAGDHDG